MTSQPVQATSTTSTGRWKLLLEQSQARFTARNWGLIHVPGSLSLRSGDAVVDRTGGLIELAVEADLTTITTGNAKRDSDLAKRSLLNSGTHPTVSFRGGGAPWAAPQQTGSVTVRGVEVPVELTVKFLEQGANHIVVHVETVLDRQPWGMRIPRLLIGRWVEVSVDATFVRVDAPPP